ncbi:cell cycle arrest protein BFA1 [Microdochium nivale]|nr:cell cycle arrest protein BFA1 [Microdochium nivale]
MEPLTLKPRQPVEDDIENWDEDEDFLVDNDDLAFRSSSSMTGSRSHRRDSLSSLRSDRESLSGREERFVHLPDTDEKSTMDAIAAAAHAGIPIPANVPSSALMGGTIKRLGGHKVKKIFQEDWADDLEMPTPGQALRVKQQDPTSFPEAIRQVSGSGLISPFKPSPAFSPTELSFANMKATPSASPLNLDKFRDVEDDEDFFGDGAATIKAPKLRLTAKPIPLITPPTPQKQGDDDGFEMDFELPSDGKLKLSNRRDIPKTPSVNASDDFDWGEGSLGTRFGGTSRGPFSTRSSSVSAMSPSIASSVTAGSEDEHLDGLEFPIGPLDLRDRLSRRRVSRSPNRHETNSAMLSYMQKSSQPVAADKEDFLADLDIGDGDVFSPTRSTLHRNVKVKATKPISPVRPKTAVSITFGNKSAMSMQTSRLPRPMSGHERTHTQTSLEPVSESGGPIATRPSRRPQSRLSGHSAQSSISSLHTPTTPTMTSTYQQPTPSRRRELGSKVSIGALRSEPTTTNAQLLRLKRSLPVLRAGQSPTKPLTASTSASKIDRPPSRRDTERPLSFLRPRTPVDRSRPAFESSAAISRKAQAPFSSFGTLQSQTALHTKTTRTFRRHDSDYGLEFRPASRTASRNMMRSPSPRRIRHEKHSSDSTWQHLNKPRRARAFGDGHELDAFDDLPTSFQTESKFTKQAVGSGNKGNIRNKIYQNVLPDRKTPSPISPYSPLRHDFTPHFARDTAASRNAREANLAQRVTPATILAPLTTHRVVQSTTRTIYNQSLPLHPHSHSLRPKKTRKPPQLKPHLISNLTGAKETKVVNGMTYNPATFRWEGNENVLNAFNPPATSPMAIPIPSHAVREKEALTPGPVLIKDMSSSKMRKQVGDMVFDPQNMCWIKVQPEQYTPTPRSNDPLGGFQVVQEDDPFKDIPDLEEKEASSGNVTRGRVSDVHDEWMVGEEFDVGPEFIRRQREEEERWRKKCDKWVSTPTRDQDVWRWTIRDIISSI